MYEFIFLYIQLPILVIITAKIVLDMISNKLEEKNRNNKFNNEEIEDEDEDEVLIQVQKEAIELNEVKSICDNTEYFEPVILKEFPNFDKFELFLKIEEDLKNILTSVSNNILINSEKLDFIQENVNELIKTNFKNHEQYKYSEIKFHNHGIKKI